MTMKKNLYLAITILLAATIFAACNNDKADEQEPVNMSNLQFSITAEDYGTDEEISETRTSALANTKDTIDLDEDIEAEISIEREPVQKTVSTRSTLLNGTYSICAYKTDGTRMPGILKGTFSGGTFTADPVGSSLWVPSDDTYTFVCYNSHMTDDGTNITIDTPSPDAMVGITTVYVTGKKQQVPFTVKHACARMRVSAKSYTPNIFFYGVCKADNNDVPTKSKLNVTTNTYTPVTTGALPGAPQYISGNNYSNTPVQAYDWCYKTDNSSYIYLLPGTPLKKLKLAFSNLSAYNKSLTNIDSKLNWPYGDSRLSANSSYAIRITFKYNFKYLFSDGTSGTLKANPSKTPIGLVLKSNDGTPGSGLAMALTSANFQYWMQGFSCDINSTTFHLDPQGACADMDGYKWTYDPTINVGAMGAGTQAHADLPYYYPAFGAAASYTPGVPVTGSNIGKWFLPSLGQWTLFFKLFSNGQNLWVAGTQYGSGNIYFTLLHQSKYNMDLDNLNLWSSSDGGYPTGNDGGGYYVNLGNVNTPASLCSHFSLSDKNFIVSCYHPGALGVQGACYKVFPFVNF